MNACRTSRLRLAVVLTLLAPGAAMAAPASGLPAQHGIFDSPAPAERATQGGAPYQRLVPAAPYGYLSNASPNDVAVATGPVTVFSVVACNTASAARFLRLYNRASAPNAAAAPVLRYSLPAGAGCASLLDSAAGLALDTGLAFDITAANGDADQTATAAGDVSLNLGLR